MYQGEHPCTKIQAKSASLSKRLTAVTVFIFILSTCQIINFINTRQTPFEGLKLLWSAQSKWKGFTGATRIIGSTVYITGTGL